MSFLTNLKSTVKLNINYRSRAQYIMTLRPTRMILTPTDLSMSLGFRSHSRRTKSKIFWSDQMTLASTTSLYKAKKE
jgi:hypothetical protein